jgi:hypothetical protein
MERRIKGKQRAIGNQKDRSLDKEEKWYDVWIQERLSERRVFNHGTAVAECFLPFDTGQGSGPSHNNMQV